VKPALAPLWNQIVVPLVQYAFDGEVTLIAVGALGAVVSI
jgi:hypothetical protein